MATYELTLMVPVKVKVDDVANTKEAFDCAAPHLADWSKAQSGGVPTGYQVTLVESEEVES